MKTMRSLLCLQALERGANQMRVSRHVDSPRAHWVGSRAGPGESRGGTDSPFPVQSQSGPMGRSGEDSSEEEPLGGLGTPSNTVTPPGD